MHHKVQYRLLVVLAFLLVLSACSSNKETVPATQAPTNSEAPIITEKTDAKRLTVVTTVYPIYEFTKQIAGDYADIISMIPMGADSHHWEPSAKDLATLQSADVFVYNGIIEEWADQVLASVTSSKRLDIVATDGIHLLDGVPHTHGDHDDDHAHDDHSHDDHSHDDHSHDDHSDTADDTAHSDSDTVLDPHVWLSPVLAQEQVKTIADGLILADPDNADGYRSNADAYISNLQELDKKYTEVLGNAKRKEIVTQHQAFGYLAKEYGLTEQSIAGLSTEQEPSPKQLAQMVTFIKERDVKVIFFETLTSPKIAQTLADETGVSIAVLNPLEGLTADDVTNNRDYLTIMYNNLEALSKGLND